MLPISVLMPVHNAQEFLPAAIQSILGQTFAHFELVIVDDGSTDGTDRIIAEWAEREPRIRSYTNPTNQGLIKTLSRGVRYCRGKYIARMDADDISLPARLEIQHRYLEGHPDIDVLGCATTWIDRQGRPLGSTMVEPSDPAFVWFQMFFRCALHHPTVFCRSQVYQRFNEESLEEEYPHAEDYAFWLRIGFEHRFENLPEPLLETRLHGGNVSIKYRQLQRDSQVRAAGRAYRRLLGQEISPEVINAFMFYAHVRVESPSTILAAIQCMNLLQEKFLQEYPLTKAQRQVIKRYAFYKLSAFTSLYRRSAAVLLKGAVTLFGLLPARFFWWLPRFVKDCLLGRP